MRADEIPKYKSSEMGDFFCEVRFGSVFFVLLSPQRGAIRKKYNILGAKIIIFTLYFITLWVVKVSTIK